MTTAREQAIEVMAQTHFDKYYYVWSNILSCCHSEEQHRSHMMETAREDARLALDALLATTQEQTCPACGGTGRVCRLVPRTARVEDAPCPNPDCSVGVVPGTEPLVLLCPEQVGWLVPDGLGFNIYRTEANGMDWRCFAHGKRPSDAVAVYRRAGSPDE